MPVPRRPQAGEDTAACRRAEGIRRVSLGELHSPCGELVEVRRLVKRAPVATQVSPAEIIGHDEKDVRLAGIRGVERSQGCQQQDRED